MKEVEANKKAWGLLAADHYNHFKKILNENYKINDIIMRELGNLQDKDIIHLQCNTGADSIKLAQAGAKRVTGIDLVPGNVVMAGKLSKDYNIANVRFIESDIMTLAGAHKEKYDVVFTSEGAVCWLPDLDKWAKTIAGLLKPGGFFYVFDIHPFYLMFDEEKFRSNVLEIKYPYFVRQADKGDELGGYAAERRNGENYSWMYTLGGIVNVLINAGLTIEFLNEHNGHLEGMGGCLKREDDGLFYSDFTRTKIPMSFSVKAKLPR